METQENGERKKMKNEQINRKNELFMFERKVCSCKICIMKQSGRAEHEHLSISVN